MKTETTGKSPRRKVLIIASAVMIITLAAGLWINYRSMEAEAHVRYVGISNVAAEKVALTVRAMEMNAKNVFDEVSKHMDPPETAVAALQSKASLNPEAKGYFAAFRPNFFQQKGYWFEPYVHRNEKGIFVMSQVGSARHDYTKSGWYMRAKEQKEEFWSDPYYYQDNDEIGLSGLYCTFVKPVFDAKDSLACVCGADITLEWMAKKLRHIDESARTDATMNKFFKGSQKFYTVLLKHDGSPIAHPEDKPLTITDPDVLTDMARETSGITDMTVNGVPARVYYTPLEDINWTVALVVPAEELRSSFLFTSLSLIAITLAGIIFIFIVLRKKK